MLIKFSQHSIVKLQAVARRRQAKIICFLPDFKIDGFSISPRATTLFRAYYEYSEKSRFSDLLVQCAQHLQLEYSILL